MDDNITVIEANSTLLDDPPVDTEADSLFVSKSSASRSPVFIIALVL